ncbi:hypothetical protein [Devosia geojensis]|uniref:hypothetical protein n=1 Tax=Devosia geojensis TaxID=443610 RepID=UPI00128E6079|nr:hypothetical protein [Devosia geojensis]
MKDLNCTVAVDGQVIAFSILPRSSKLRFNGALVAFTRDCGQMGRAWLIDRVQTAVARMIRALAAWRSRMPGGGA